MKTAFLTRAFCLIRNVAAARSANVLVTVHGSGSNNALLMEEGSALIEVRPYDFGTRAHGWANFFMPKARCRPSLCCGCPACAHQKMAYTVC